MKLQWLASMPASAQYAAAALMRGWEFVDPSLAAVLAEPVDDLRRTCEAAGVDPVLLADHLAAGSIEPSPVVEIARFAVRKVAGEAQMAELADAVHDFAHEIQHQFEGRFRDVVEELELRSLPLRELWEARGPGMMKTLGYHLGAEVVPRAADGILVLPVTGGGGIAHVAYNRVSFEAMLANITNDLPEIVRLGWLLAHLQLDLRSIQGNLTRQQVLRAGALGLVPAVLTAAHDVQLTGPMEPLLPQALELWRLDPRHAETLLAWWHTFVTDRLTWGPALTALDQMLPG